MKPFGWEVKHLKCGCLQLKHLRPCFANFASLTYCCHANMNPASVLQIIKHLTSKIFHRSAFSHDPVELDSTSGTLIPTAIHATTRHFVTCKMPSWVFTANSIAKVCVHGWKMLAVKGFIDQAVMGQKEAQACKYKQRKEDVGHRWDTWRKSA